jgi:hypothetical protein
MSTPSVLILYHSVLFRDIFTGLLARRGAVVKASAHPDKSLASEALPAGTAVLVETCEGDPEFIHSVHKLWTETLLRRSKSVSLYAVDVMRDRIVEYGKRRKPGPAMSLDAFLRKATSEA